jgi:hypothetical protein
MRTLRFRAKLGLKDLPLQLGSVMRGIIGAADPLGVLRNWDWSNR